MPKTALSTSKEFEKLDNDTNIVAILGAPRHMIIISLICIP